MKKLGNTLKFVSGIILFVIGVVISYEVMVYNLVQTMVMEQYPDYFAGTGEAQ